MFCDYFASSKPPCFMVKYSRRCRYFWSAGKKRQYDKYNGIRDEQSIFFWSEVIKQFNGKKKSMLVLDFHNRNTVTQPYIRTAPYLRSYDYIDRFVRGRGKSSALAMGLRLSCSNPSISDMMIQYSDLTYLLQYIIYAQQPGITCSPFGSVLKIINIRCCSLQEDYFGFQEDYFGSRVFVKLRSLLWNQWKLKYSENG